MTKTKIVHSGRACHAVTTAELPQTVITGHNDFLYHYSVVVTLPPFRLLF